MLNVERMVVLVLMVCFGRSVMAQDAVTLEAELSRGRVYLGDVVTYQVLVRGAADGTPPAVEFPDGVTVEYRGASSQKFTTMRSINGRQRTVTDAYYKHQYLLTVVKEGEVVIPGAVLEMGSGRYVSNPVQLTAVMPLAADGDRVVVELPDRAVYVGETAVVGVSWWVADQTESLNFESSVFPDSIRVVAVSPEKGVSAGGQELQMELFGQRFLAHLDQGIFEGRPMTRLRFDLELTPSRTGRFEFGPVRVVFTRKDSFGRAAKMYAESVVQTLEVVEVPVDGRPAGYRGLIGVYRAQTDASNTSVNVGDPIEFRLLVSGAEPMVGLEKTLDAQLLSSKGFRVSSDGWREVERRRNGERLFTTTIRAMNDEVTEIPAIELPAFNPETGEFVVFASDPIPLDVRAVRSVTLSDAVVSGKVEDRIDAQQERVELGRNPSVMWVHPTAAEIRSSAKGFSLWAVMGDPVWVGVMVLIGGVPMVVWIRRGVAVRRDPRAVAIGRAWKEAKRLRRKGDDVGAIRVYGGAILGIDAESLTGADLRELGVSEEIVERSSAVLSEAEGRAYGAIAEGRSDESLLEAMRRDVRRHTRGDGTGRQGRTTRRIQR